MQKSTFQIIQEKIATVSEEAVGTFNSSLVTTTSAEMYRLGFTSSPSVVKEMEKLNMDEVHRARMIRYFGGKVLFESELRAFESKYNLKTHTAERFKDNIPERNQKEIVEFSERLKAEKLNQGRVETDLYFIPITDKYLVTAPPSCFRKALNWKEMDKAEREKWMREDPIVWKRIWRFNPSAYEPKDRNVLTNMLLLITAWGLEEFLINTN